MEGGFLQALNFPGRASVWMFFGLSGYVIGFGFFSNRYAFTLSGVMHFYRCRAMRIMPLFWLVSLLAVFACLAGVIPWELNWGDLLSAFFSIQYNHLNYPVGIFWTLGIEIQFYVLAPLICWLLVVSSRRWLVLGLGSLVALLFVFGSTIDLRTLPSVMMFFLTGILAARQNTESPPKAHFARLVPLVALAIVCLMICSLTYPARFWWYFGPISTIVALVALLRAHAILERISVPAGPVMKALMVIGCLAYGLYAWHGLLLNLWAPLQDSLLATFSISLFLAWLSFILMERPLVNIYRAEGHAH
ncbi:acyltransferase [Roseicyclus marinus]